MIHFIPFDSIVGILSSFGCALLTIVLFSVYYVKKYTNPVDSTKETTITAITSLVIALLTCSLLPIDIFIVSSMKYPNGTFKEWASNETIRNHFENQVLYSYYSVYSLIFVFIFVILPFMYFYYEEREITFDSNPFFRSLKRTILVELIFIILVSCYFLITTLYLKPGPNTHQNETWIDKFKNIIDELEKNSGEDTISILLNILTFFGVSIVAFYTAFGMFSWPINWIKGTKSARNQMQEIEDRHLNNAFNINCLREKLRTTGHLTDSELNRLNRLEEQERRTNIEERFVNSYRNSLFYRFRYLIRPIQIFSGIIILLISLLIWISLTITNVDKALHSVGWKMGFVLNNATLPNPIDLILSQMQKIYPMDYIFVLMLSFSLVIYTMSGFQNIGMRYLCVQFYKIVPGKTAPQALLFLFALIMLAILGMNILFFSAFPHYATYGSQYFQEQTIVNNTITLLTKKCQLDSPQDACTVTRMSALLLRFFYKANLFGIFYYCMMWAFLIVSLGSFVYVTFKPKQTITEELLGDMDDFEEEIY
ncbi:putative lysosomal cobalamin transporter [Sarcoptes scabiei]|uniref:Putative lysosomal cobalamin transporter n=1 Tax=Sarcoptes scabiei TaxID=52283 RepID=A0A834R1W8_SARSC|nr:putative lysosomal cobalamin transporter [Sarcoptes scabiei]